MLNYRYSVPIILRVACHKIVVDKIPSNHVEVELVKNRSNIEKASKSRRDRKKC